MAFDRMGRRVEYIETVNDVTNVHYRFVYDGYLCIQRLTAAANNAVDLAFGWDPSEPVATRPLWMQRPSDSNNFFYFHDGNKNVSELVSYQTARGVPAHYEYAPFGAVTAATTNTTFTAFNVAATNPYRFSSEYADDSLGLVYYNYRHYEPETGRWLQRDPVEEEGGLGIYAFLNNQPVFNFDYVGLADAQACQNGAQPEGIGIDGYILKNSKGKNDKDTGMPQYETLKEVIVTKKKKDKKETIKASGMVDLGKLNITACCKCESGKWNLRISVVSSYTMKIAIGGRDHPWGERSPDGIRRSIEHEKLHVKAFEQLLKRIYLGLVDAFSTREFDSLSSCGKAWGASRIQALIKAYDAEWTKEESEQFSHKGKDWDEWRSKNLSTETSKESW